MPKPPKPTQKTYRGVSRRQMISAYRHLVNIYYRDLKLRAGPVGNYPNQLYTLADQTTLLNCTSMISRWKTSTGPIVSR